MKKFVFVLVLVLLSVTSVCFGQEILTRPTTPEERAEIESGWYNNNPTTPEEQKEIESDEQNTGIKVYDFYDIFSEIMNNRGYNMSVYDCYTVNNNVIGEYLECDITNDVYIMLVYDNNFTTKIVKVAGYQKKPGKLNPDIDTAFRVAYSCFYGDTRETTYQNWLEKIKYSMNTYQVYTLYGISAIWNEGLLTGKSARNGQYYYQITFFLDRDHLE